MSRPIAQIAEEMKRLQDEMEEALQGIRDQAEFTIQNRRVIFDEELKKLHLSKKRGAMQQLLQARFFVLLTAPVIYSVAIPFALLDLFATVYQIICFPIYGIKKVSRRDYMIFDRRYLAYLNWIEKLNCAYCSYATAVLAYVFEITSRTEQYWCPIKHARRIYQTHERYLDFVDFGDADAYREERQKLREQLKP